ncbi:hypothetical protein DPSP01_014015 [Paraphaeosphaeria sporulosa]
MTTHSSTFPVQQTQGPLQFVPYNGPPKQTARRLPTKKKALPGDDDTRRDREELAHAAHGVEVGDLMYSADNEADYDISGSGRGSNDLGSRMNRSHQIANSRIYGASDDEHRDDGERADGYGWSGVAERDDDWSFPRERNVNYEQNGHAGETPFGTLESLNQDYIAQRGSQNITSSIDDRQVHPMADDGKEDEYPSQRADSSAQNTTGDLAPMLDESEVIDLTDIGDESGDDDEGERERKYPSSRSRSSSVLQDAPCSARPAGTQSPTLSPSSGIIQAGYAVTHGDLSFMADAGISSSDQLLQKARTHAIQDSMVEPWQQSQRSEPTSDQGKRLGSGNAFAVPNSSKANIHRSEA